MKYSIVSKKDSKSFHVEQRLIQMFRAYGWTYDDIYPSLVICVGGDGTLLYAVNQYIDIINEVQFVGIHTGTLGFFTDYTEDEIEECVRDILNKKPHIDSYSLLEIQLDNKEKSLYALNEMRVENVVKSQILDIYIDDEFFETSRGSGVCICTQPGSTAYNRSLRGAVIDPGMEMMQLTEITPIQHSKHRSLGVPYIMMKNRRIRMTSDTFDTAMLCYDHKHVSLKDTKEIICTLSDKKVNFARYREYSYLKRLKNLY